MKTKITFLFLLLGMITSAQDIIVTRDAKRIEAKILEVSSSEIKYKELDYLDGPTFIFPIENIASITYGNGRVVQYHDVQKETNENANDPSITGNSSYMPTALIGTDSTESKWSTLKDYLEGFPKKLLAIHGDHSMIRKENCTIFVDFRFSPQAMVGEYGHNSLDFMPRGSFEKYKSTHAWDFNESDKEWIVNSACETFNNKLFGSKCTLFPMSKMATANIQSKENCYTLTLYIEKIDLGSTTVSNLTNKRTNSGGVIIFGIIKIMACKDNSYACAIVVDRVKGLGASNMQERIKNAVVEIISNQLFYIKDYILY